MAKKNVSDLIKQIQELVPDLTTAEGIALLEDVTDSVSDDGNTGELEKEVETLKAELKASKDMYVARFMSGEPIKTEPQVIEPEERIPATINDIITEKEI